MNDDVTEPAPADFELPRVLAALADRHRLAAVRFVARHGESWCARIMQDAGLDMSKSTFSHHLRILREAGVVARRTEGTRSYMCVRKADLDARFPGLIDSILNPDEPSVPPPHGVPGPRGIPGQRGVPEQDAAAAGVVRADR